MAQLHLLTQPVLLCGIPPPAAAKDYSNRRRHHHHYYYRLHSLHGVQGDINHHYRPHSLRGNHGDGENKSEGEFEGPAVVGIAIGVVAEGGSFVIAKQEEE